MSPRNDDPLQARPTMTTDLAVVVHQPRLLGIYYGDHRGKQQYRGGRPHSENNSTRIARYLDFFTDQAPVALVLSCVFF